MAAFLKIAILQTFLHVPYVFKMFKKFFCSSDRVNLIPVTPLWLEVKVAQIAL